MLRAFGLIILFFGWIWSLNAQASFRLQGFVVDEKGEGLPGAHVMLHETHQVSVCGSSGFFLFTGLKQGHYHLHITYLGYQSLAINILITQDTILPAIALKVSELELSEVVIEHREIKQSGKESSLSIRVVNKDFLSKNIAGGLMSALEQLPGVNSSQTGLSISKPVIRGMSGSRVVVAELGVKQEGQQWGADHGLEIDPLQVDQLELVKGPLSLIYGSDAMGGVIQIRPPQHEPQGRHLIKASGIYRSVNQTYGSHFLARGAEGSWFYSVKGTLLRNGDYQVPAESFVYNGFRLPIYEGRIKNTAGQEAHYAMQVGISKTWGYSRLTFSRYQQHTGLFPGAIGTPRAYGLEHFGQYRNIAAPAQNTRHYKVISNSNIKWGKKWLEIDLGYQRNHRDELSRPHAHGRPLVFEAGQDSLLAHGLRLNSLSKNARLHFGYKAYKFIIGWHSQYQWHQFEGFEFLLPQYQLGQTALYAIGKRTFKDIWHLNGGLRYDVGVVNIKRHEQEVWRRGQMIGIEERVPAINRLFQNWSGSVGLARSMGNHEFKLNLAKSFRLPTPQELSVNGVHHGSFRHELGDANLNAESGWQADFTYRHQQKKLFIELTPFLNYFTNYIYLRPTARFSTLPEAGQLYLFEQAEAILTGAELLAEWHPLKPLHIEMGLEYVHAQNLNLDLPISFIPPFQVKMNAEYEWEHIGKGKRLQDFYIRAGWRGAAAQYRVDRNERTTPAYHLFNLGVGFDYKYHQKREPIELNIQVQNLFNTAYYNHLSRWRMLNLPEPGRNISIQMTIPFELKR